MPSKFNTTILVAPLDWGLGHATRCIPLIEHLTKAGCTVLIAAEGYQKELLASEFPNHRFVHLKGYKISYSVKKRFFSLKILLQVPKIVRAITAEHRWLKQVVKKYNIDAIISDNRYGLWHRHVPSVVITHQLQLQTHRLFIKAAQFVIYRFLNRFSTCWIPDLQGHPNIAGKLSHPAKLPRIPLVYLGGISRFRHSGTVPVSYDLLVVISGPEPQRSLFERTLLSQLKAFSGKVLFVRGLPGNSPTPANFNQVSIVNHLPAAELNKAFEQSNFIISRSGYTTVMDILRLRKRSVLVPTPGQTEQEYLAKHLQHQHWAYWVDQKAFNLQQALSNAQTFDYNLPDINMEHYQERLNAFLKSLWG